MTQNGFSRRGFLRGAVAGAAALVAPVPGLPAAFGGTNAPANGKFTVVVNLFGGNDGINTVIPTHLQPYTERRPNIALTENLHALSGGYALHQNLNNLKGFWDDSDLHVVNMVGYPNRNLSHFTSQNIYSYGVRDIDGNGDGRGWLGRFADAYCANPVEPLGIVSVGTGNRRDFEADTGAALALNDVASFNFQADTDWQTDHRLRLKVLREVLDAEGAPPAGPALTVYGTSRQAHDLVDRVADQTAGFVDPGNYPNTTIGRRLKTVSQLLTGIADFGTKVFYTGFGGFDTHSDQLTRHANLMTQLDEALGAFAADLKARNLWDDCVVVVISEFGRRNFENGSLGTDHGHGNCFLLAGGAVAGQQVTGEVTEADLNLDQPEFLYDFREIYSDIIANHLGVPATPVFPETFVNTGQVSLVT